MAESYDAKSSTDDPTTDESCVLKDFILEYQRQKLLWDPKHPDYHRKNMRQKALQVLLPIYKRILPKAEIRDVKRKINTLKSNYNKHARRIVKSKLETPHDIYVPRAEHFYLLNFLGETYTPCFKKTARVIEGDGQQQKSKPKSSHFSQVKKACVELVKVHGRPVAMFDDVAFKDLINLIPLTAKERETITSEYVQQLIDKNEEAGEVSTDMDITTDQTFDDRDDDDDDEEEEPLRKKVKGEVVVCACGKNVDDANTKHDSNCPLSTSDTLQTYWNYFEISMDEAKCSLCNKNMTWTTMSKLKEHLQRHHPDIEFLDDDDEFQRGPPSSAGSRADMEEIYLEDTLFQEDTTTAKTKRKKAKQALLGDKPVTTENIASSLYRFKSLDNFGTYVASLMKLIPKDKCIKFQIQIIDRLLREQAAAA